MDVKLKGVGKRKISSYVEVSYLPGRNDDYDFKQNGEKGKRIKIVAEM